jgi:molybdopterin-guanine dinucleotide biosynthesis protein
LDEKMKTEIHIIDADKIGSATSPLNLSRTVAFVSASGSPRAGDVVVVRALTDSATYNMLELPTGRLAKINPGDVLLGVLGRRRALKGFVGDVPGTLKAGDHLHLLNMGGVIGLCTGHHSSLGEAIRLEVIGVVCDEQGRALNIADAALPLRSTLGETAPIVMIAGTSMNSGKTYAATELIKQANRAGLKIAAAKLSGVACLRDTLNMADHGAIATASFLDCGLPSTVGAGDLAPVAKAIISRLNESAPDLIVIELGDGILGGYSVESIFEDVELQEATAAIIFCASDYVGAWGGIELLRRRGIGIDLVAGSVTDSQMGQDYVEREFGVPAANARRDGARLFEMIRNKVSSFEFRVPSSETRGREHQAEAPGGSAVRVLVP